MSTYTELRNRATAKRTAVETRSLTTLRTRQPAAVDLGGSIAASQTNASIFGTSGRSRRQAEGYQAFKHWVFVCVNAIAKRIAGQPWMAGNLEGAPDNPVRTADGMIVKQPWYANRVGKSVREKAATENELDILATHPVLDAMARPNPLQRKFEFLYSSAVNLLLTGVSYWVGGVVKNKDGESQLELWSVPSNLITPIHDGGLFTGYKVKMQPSVQPLVLKPENVARTYFPDPSDITAVYPPVAACWASVNTDTYIQTSQEQLFERGLTPRWAVTVNADAVTKEKPVLQGPQRRQIIRAIRDIMRQTTNYGDPAILDGMIESIINLDPKPKEMDWTASGDIVRQRIFATYGVNKFVVGMPEGMNKAQAYVAESSFCRNTVNPIANSFSETATEWLGPMYDKPARLVVWVEPCQSVDEDRKQKAMFDARKNNDITKNELRADLGLPPVEEEERSPLLDSQAGITGAVSVLTATGQGFLGRDQAATIFQTFYGLPREAAELLAGSDTGTVPDINPKPPKPAVEEEEEPNEEAPAIGDVDEGKEAKKKDKHGSHDQSSHGRGGGGSPPSEAKPTAKTKSEIAKASAVRVDSEIQRYAEDRNESQLAKKLGGKALDDNEPADVTLEIGGKTHGIEVKTMVVGKNDKITMKRDAQERKAKWERKNKAKMHTVVIDDREVFNANGPGKHDESKRKILYRRGYGSFRTGGMHEVTGGTSELKSLMSKRRNQLPPAARLFEVE